jgi:polyisoprenoid-binding protein YceI
MKKEKIKIAIISLLILSFSSNGIAQSNSIEEFKGNWYFKTHESKITFKIGNMFIFNVKGEVPLKDGHFKNTDEIYVEAVFDIASISTGIDKRDNHLKSEDFFYTEKYPVIEFKTSIIEKNNSDEDYSYQTKGKLKIRGIEKEELVLFNIEKIKTSEILITGMAKINRLDYDVDYEMSGMDDKATVKFEVKANLKE